MANHKLHSHWLQLSADCDSHVVLTELSGNLGNRHSDVDNLEPLAFQRQGVQPVEE